MYHLVVHVTAFLEENMLEIEGGVKTGLRLMKGRALASSFIKVSIVI